MNFISWKSLGAVVLLGETVEQITQSPDEVILCMASGKAFRFDHNQDCCEKVRIEKTEGVSLALLTAGPISHAEIEVLDGIEPDWYKARYLDDSHTWTRITVKAGEATVVWWWLGESNGYYGEGVSLVESETPWKEVAS